MFGIDDGPYCAVGAIGRVIPPYRLSYFDSTALGVSAVEALYDALPPDAKERRTCEGNWTAVSVWQDEDERTHTEVLALFDRAIAALE